MYRRNFLKTMGLAAFSAVLPKNLSAKKTEPKPNVIFLLIDDMGFKDVGFMGSKFYETPNIDKLASEGMVFTNAYANAPNCAPTRACIMSGQYTPRHGVYTVGNSDRGPAHLRKLIPVKNKTVLDPGTVTIAESLKKSGYTSISIGKWHLGMDPDSGPIAQGFDRNIAGNHRGSPPSYFSPYKNPDIQDGPKGEYLTDRLTDEAIKFIEDNKGGPFFLYLPYYAVHMPIRGKKELIKKYEKKTPHNGQGNPKYAAMVDSTDQGIGRIMDKLNELKLAENTVVIFFSDNGGHAKVTSMKPLRGSKGMLYEGGIREPMIVRWPKKIKPGAVCDTAVIGTDFYPTLLEITGSDKPHAQPLDGKSIMPLLTQTGSFKRDAIFWHFPAYLQRYSTSQGAFRTTPASAIRKGDYKLIEFFEDGKLELYNLKEDISESNDLSKKLPAKTKELHADLVSWRKTINAPVPTEKNPLYNPGKKARHGNSKTS